jgi:cell division protein FtsA
MAAKNESTYIGLDIGSTKVACVVGVAQPDSPDVSIMGLGSALTTGVRRGVVVDLEETVSAVTAALEEAERMSGTVIERVTVAVDGAHIQSLNSRGVIAVSRADKQISREDMARAEDAAAALSLEANREILKVVPRSYVVDGQGNIVDPFGMTGVRLEIDTHIITASIPAMKNLDDAVHRAGIVSNGYVITPLASARACLTKRQKELGVAILDIGAETTGVAIFEDGKISYTNIIPLGSSHITKDLSHALRVTIDTAEKIKCQFGVARKPKPKDSSRHDLSKIGVSGTLLARELDTIIEARLAEFCDYITKELAKSQGGAAMLASGTIITGGGSKLQGLPEYMEHQLKMPVARGQARSISGIIDRVKDPAYATAIGLMLEDLEQPQAGKSINDRIGQVIGKVRSIFKGFIPRSS